MPILIAKHRNPISPSLLHWRKLEVANAYLEAVKGGDNKAMAEWKRVMDTWIDHVVDTGMGVAVHPDKGYKMVPDAPYLRELNARTELLDGHAVMPDGMFENIDGPVYTAADVESYGNRPLSQEQALASPLWTEFIPNRDLRTLAIKYLFLLGKQRFDLDAMMGAYFPRAQEKPVMGLWSFWGLEDRSNAGGRVLLGVVVGRLIGVEPNVAEGDVQKLEYIIRTVQTE